MLNTIKKTILSYQMLKTGDIVLVALSGGPDSVCLLHCLNEIKEEFGLTLFAAHLNHCLRGEESERDEKFCKNVSESLDVPFFAERKDINYIKEKIGFLSWEDVARRERYGFLQKIALQCNASKIAVGHTADDQVETVLMRLVRGAGTKGLSGIPPKRALKTDKPITYIIRPLIDVWKDDIFEFLKNDNILYVQDSSNKDSRFFRNKIRHHLIPELYNYNANIKSVLHAEGKILSFAHDYLDLMADKAFRDCAKFNENAVVIDVSTFCSFHIAIRQLLIKKISENIDPLLVLETTHIDSILELTSNTNGTKGIDLPGKLRVERIYDQLIFKDKGRKFVEFFKELPINGKLRCPDINILIASELYEKKDNNRSFGRDINGNMSIVNKKKGLSFNAELDYDKLTLPLFVRNKKPGDRVRPIGMRKGTKKIKDIFIDAKVPKAERRSIPVIISGKDICWVVGHRIGEDFKVESGTKKILKITVEV